MIINNFFSSSYKIFISLLRRHHANFPVKIHKSTRSTCLITEIRGELIPNIRAFWFQHVPYKRLLKGLETSPFSACAPFRIQPHTFKWWRQKGGPRVRI